LTLRQPTERHGGTARFDEETKMVSKTLQSLDLWLAEAEKVLAEQGSDAESKCERGARLTSDPVQLRFNLGDD